MAPTIQELDTTVRAFYESRGEQQKAAQLALNQFREDPDAWMLVDKILQEAEYPQTKCTSACSRSINPSAYADDRRGRC
jgi:exportin-1